MELLRIGEEKLKIILSSEDLLSFEIEASELDYANTETKRMLWEILHRAKQSVGFDTDGHRVLVQLYPSRDGGCEMFVTKLGADHEKEVNLLPLCPKKSRTAKEAHGRLGAFSFATLSDLLSVCRRLYALGHKSLSEVYYSDDERYFLFLDGLDATGYFAVDEYSFLYEYGSSEPTETARAMLSEHGRAVCEEHAVARLGVL